MNSSIVPELLDYLRAANRESEWVEFKMNDDDPEQIGEYISALANSATLVGKRFGYIVWGVSNITHDIVGTTVRLHEKKVGNEAPRFFRKKSKSFGASWRNPHGKLKRLLLSRRTAPHDKYVTSSAPWNRGRKLLDRLAGDRRYDRR